ncbi:C-X-C motif chemokine 10 [Larimichthys crocea]|uniref:CXCL_F2 n=1 Tax=Larimichthys crocea TaxID=215358 RepID=A0A1I9RZU8_LARCR|nr:C-X-C motif chemokine 10 [Larimichthys crocea]AOZ57501.1 CXCL_F2 [Larimichthys crocea]
MSGIIKVFLLLAVTVCVSKAHTYETGQQCLCRSVRQSLVKSATKDIQIYPATIFCDKVEIVVTTNAGLRYCLNPNLKAVKKLLANVINKQSQIQTSTPRPTENASTPGSTDTARI